MRKIMLLLITILLTNSVMALITEVYPNPKGVDTHKEWIEVIIPLSVLNSNKTIFVSDNSKNVSLQRIRINNSLVLIVENASLINNTNCSILYTPIIGNGLNNNGDTVNIFYIENNSIVSLGNITYNSTIEGKSISWINNSWIFTDPSPCMIPTINNSTTRNTTNATFNQSKPKQDCYLYITSKDVYRQGERIYYTIHSSDWPVQYWITDIDGKTIKSKRSTMNKYKSFTPINEQIIIIYAKNKCRTTHKLIAIKKNRKRELSINKLFYTDKLLVDYSATSIDDETITLTIKCGTKQIKLDSYVMPTHINNVLQLDICGNCTIQLNNGKEKETQKIFIPCKKRLEIKSIIMNTSFLSIKSNKPVVLKKGNILIQPETNSSPYIFHGLYMYQPYSICSQNECIGIYVTMPKASSTKNSSKNELTAMTVKTNSTSKYGWIGLPIVLLLLIKMNKLFK